ncbi:MAG: hypothetical protein MI922_20400 [Bacteroidales bacterium]|nr:hypothetical protein [Bacteroidales bacterium]
MKTDDYINKYRNELDIEEPDEQLLWEGIRSDLEQRRRFSKSLIWKVAAILILCVSVTYVFINEQTFSKKINAPLSEINSELGDREIEYINTINSKLSIIETSASKSNELVTALLDELVLLDTIYQMALRDLNQNGYKEQVVNTVFDTYEKRIRVLERIILETQKQEHYETEKRIEL